MTNAICHVRTLIKRQPSLRASLHSISKSEEKGEQGATEAREQLTANLQKSINAAEGAINRTEEHAATAERMAFALRQRTLPQHPLSRICHLTGVPETRLAGLAALADHTARKSADIATEARDRLDAAEPVVRSTAVLALFLAKLPQHGFKKDHPALAGLRRELHDLNTASKKVYR